MILSTTMSATEVAWSRADRLAFWILVAEIIVVAVHTLRRGNKNSSVASMIPLNAEVRDMYDRDLESFLGAKFYTPLELEILEREITTRLEKLMNVLEISAAILVERTFSGMSRILMGEYLQRILEDLLAAITPAIKFPAFYRTSKPTSTFAASSIESLNSASFSYRSGMFLLTRRSGNASRTVFAPNLRHETAY